jgi:hypothetical protein
VLLACTAIINYEVPNSLFQCTFSNISNVVCILIFVRIRKNCEQPFHSIRLSVARHPLLPKVHRTWQVIGHRAQLWEAPTHAQLIILPHSAQPHLCACCVSACPCIRLCMSVCERECVCLSLYVRISVRAFVCVCQCACTGLCLRGGVCQCMRTVRVSVRMRGCVRLSVQPGLHSHSQ